MVFVGDGVLLIILNIIFPCNDIHNFTMFSGAQSNLHINSTIYTHEWCANAPYVTFPRTKTKEKLETLTNM